MNLYNRYRTDEDKERGSWINFGDGLRIKVMRPSSTESRYSKVFDRKFAPHRRAIEKKAMDEATAKQLLAEVYAETVVLDWEGVTDEQGNPLPFSKKACVKVLVDLPDFAKEIYAAADDASLYRPEDQDPDLEEDSKNS